MTAWPGDHVPEIGRFVVGPAPADGRETADERQQRLTPRGSVGPGGLRLRQVEHGVLDRTPGPPLETQPSE